MELGVQLIAAFLGLPALIVVLFLGVEAIELYIANRKQLKAIAAKEQEQAQDDAIYVTLDSELSRIESMFNEALQHSNESNVNSIVLDYFETKVQLLESFAMQLHSNTFKFADMLIDSYSYVDEYSKYIVKRTSDFCSYRAIA